METRKRKRKCLNALFLGNFLVEWKLDGYVVLMRTGESPWKLPSGMETRLVAALRYSAEYLGNFLVEWKRSAPISGGKSFGPWKLPSGMETPRWSPAANLPGRPWKLPSGMETSITSQEQGRFSFLGNFLVEWKQCLPGHAKRCGIPLETS